MYITQNDIDAKRKEYMQNPTEKAHNEYYTWLAESIHLTVNSLPKGWQDEKLPLKHWDACHPHVVRFAHYYIRGTFRWSLSDSVCCLKAIARREREKIQNNP